MILRPLLRPHQPPEALQPPHIIPRPGPDQGLQHAYELEFPCRLSVCALNLASHGFQGTKRWLTFCCLRQGIGSGRPDLNCCLSCGQCAASCAASPATCDCSGGAGRAKRFLRFCSKRCSPTETSKHKGELPQRLLLMLLLQLPSPGAPKRSKV